MLREHDLRLTKRLGQHHLIDSRIIRRVVDACQLTGEETVVEIGAGLGALTESIAQRAGRVVAVEVDPRICALLRSRMRTCRNVSVVCQDILVFPWERMGPVIAVGAIPYSITSPILVSLSKHRRTIQQSVLIMQREVADRLLARSGTKSYGRLSVLAQYGWELTPLMSIPRNAFFPQPEVDSTCVRCVARASPATAVENEEMFFELVKAAFAHRRKSLVNCLREYAGNHLERSHVEYILRDLSLPVSVRGEALTLQQFASLTNALLRMNQPFLINYKKSDRRKPDGIKKVALP